ncbi:MAG: hypothetical protein NTY45_06600 [Elusimicrobia bacterium]|nr:hypothetical protein [Elusimicrobiota bacterium]
MRKVIFFIISLCIFLIPISRGYTQDRGVFFKLPVSPRAGGMGNASVALSDDPFGLYNNPAGLGFVKCPSISLVYHDYLKHISGNSFGYIYPFKNWTIGIAPTFYKVKATPASSELGFNPSEKFGQEAKIIPVAMAWRIGNHLALGLTGKSYSEKIPGQSASTTIYDIGAIWKSGGLSLGIAKQNLGTTMTSYDVVQMQRIGAAYSTANYSTAVELMKDGTDKSYIGLGGSVALANTLRLRGGWRFKDEFGGFTFGLGFALGGLAFDYSCLRYGDLGVMQNAGVSLAFGVNAGKSETSEEIELPKPIKKLIEKPVVKTVINSAPELDWTGEENYTDVGLSTGVGNLTTPFVYRVKYTDADNDSPAKGYPKVHITKGGSEVSGSPFVMEYTSGNNTTGAIYAYVKRLASGSDYTYYFEAKDSSGAAAVGVPTVPVNAPIVARAEVVVISGGTNIAVAELVGKNVSQADASIVTDFLRSELVSTGRFNVMDRNNMDTVLSEQKFQNSGCTEQECAVEMGKLLNIKKILVGSLSKLLDSYYVTVSVVDVETAKITASYSSDPVSSKEIKDACRKLVKKLSQK